MLLFNWAFVFYMNIIKNIILNIKFKLIIWNVDEIICLFSKIVLFLYFLKYNKIL